MLGECCTQLTSDRYTMINTAICFISLKQFFLIVNKKTVKQSLLQAYGAQRVLAG